jgi:hypothetical protein
LCHAVAVDAVGIRPVDGLAEGGDALTHPQAGSLVLDPGII